MIISFVDEVLHKSFTEEFISKIFLKNQHLNQSRNIIHIQNIIVMEPGNIKLTAIEISRT